MVTRFFLSALILITAAAIYGISRKVRLSKAGTTVVRDPLRAHIRRGVPTLLYFTSPACTACTYAQKPAIEKVQQEMGDAVTIITIDTTRNMDAAHRWKIRTLPTTYVLDGTGKPIELNHGTVDAGKLRRQIARAS